MDLFPQSRCLICHEIIQPAVSWSALFAEEKEKHLCSSCENKLERINGDCCRICSRPFVYLEEQFRHGDLCNDCVRWEEDSEWGSFLEKNVSLFLYNDFLKEVIARFKFRGDYILAKAFAEFLQKKMAQMTYDLLLPIPLSAERLYERGFNQAEALISESGFTPARCLTRIHSEKQSKKSRLERIHFPQVFQLAEGINVQGKKILLIDDIYTTGSTLRHAAKLLKRAGAERIQSLTLAR